MILNSQHLKEIFNSKDNDKEYPVRVYSSYNMFEVTKVIFSDGKIIIFTGDANNIEPIEHNEDGPMIA